MIADPIGYPIPHPTPTRSGYPNRPRIARPLPSRPVPSRPLKNSVVTLAAERHFRNARLRDATAARGAISEMDQ